MSNFEKTSFSEPPGANELLLVDRVEGQLARELAVRRSRGELRLPHQQEMAQVYGVSIKTVRLALERLRGRSLVKSIRGKGTFIVGKERATVDVLVVCRSTTHPFTMMSVVVAGKILAEQQRSSILVVSDDPSEEWSAFAQRYHEAGGVLLIGPYRRDVVIGLMQKSKIPIVHLADLDEEVQGPAVCDTVCSDNMAMAYRATEYLISRGHRRIAMVGWGRRSKIWNREYIRGYKEAMTASGIEPREEWIVYFPGLYSKDACEKEELDRAKRQIDEWFRGTDSPTALVHSSSSESQIRDTVDIYFHSHFAAQDVIPFVYFENLLSSYTGLRDATAVAVRCEDLIHRALELLGRSDRSRQPVRETQARVMLCRRENGVWKEVQ